MGDFNIGGLFAALNLDDTQFRAALEASGNYANIFKISLGQIGDNVKKLQTALEGAGVQTKQFQSWMSSLRGQGLSTDEAFQTLAKTLDDVQRRIVALRTADVQAAWSKSSGTMSGYAAQLAATHTAENKQAALDAVKYQQNVQAAFRALDEERRSRDRDYASLVKQLAAEEEAAKIKAQAAAEADALARQKEMQAQMVGFVAAEERLEKEKQQAIIQAERDRYYEHRRLQQAASAFQQIGVGLTVAGGIGVAADVVAAKDAAHFQDSMSKSLAVIGEVSDALKAQLAASAREAAKETGLAAKDLAEDLAILKKGGVDAATSIQLLPTFAKYAVGTSVGLHDATKQALTVMEAFGLKTGELPRILNVFASANQVARGTVDQLATSLEGRSGAALKAANVSLEQATALTVAFARRGFEASAAQTALSQVVNRLTYLARQHGDVLVDVNGKWVKFHDIIYAADGSIRPLVDTLVALNSVVTGASAEAVGNYFDDIKMGTTRGVDAVKALVAAAPEVAELTTRFQEAGSAVDQAFNQRLKSPLVQLDILKRQIQDLLITLGTPLITVFQNMLSAAQPIIQWIADAIKAFSQLPEPIQLAVAAFAILAPSLVTVTGNMFLLASAAVRTYAAIKLLAGAEGFAGLAAKVKSVEAIFTSISGMGIAATFIGIGSAVTGAALAFTKFYEDTQRMREGADALYGTVAKKIESATTTSAFSQAQVLVNTLWQNGALTAKEYASALALLKDKQDELNKSMLSSWNIGIKLKVDKKQVVDQSATDPAKARADIFSQLGLKDYQTAVDEAEKALNEGIAKGILSPEQAEVAKQGIDNLIYEWQNLGVTVHRTVVQATNDYGTGVLAAQWKTIKDNLAEATKLRAEWAKTGGVNPNPIPQLMTDSDAKTAAAAKWAEVWNVQVAQVADSLSKVNKELVQEGRIGPGGPNSEIQRIEQYAKNHGIKLVVQEDLNTQAEYAKKVLDDIYTYQKDGGVVAARTVYSAQIAFIEAEARAMHESAQDYAKSIGLDYDKLRLQVQDSVKAANTAWSRSLREVGFGFQQVARDIAGRLLDLIPIFNSTSQTNPLQPVIESFRSAYEQLSAYADPKKALEGVISSIQNAGDAATANAIAVKYFGNTSGPLLAKELRDGTLAAKDVASAIDSATQSTVDYNNQTQKTTSAITQLWQKAVHDILQLILKQLIEQGFKALIDWMFKVGDKTTSLANDMVAALKKIGQWIGVLGKGTSTVAGAAGGAIDITNLPTTAAGGITIASTIPGAVGAAGSIGSAAAGVGSTAASAGSALSTASGIANIVNAGVSIVSGIVSGIQQAHANNLLGEIEVSTRGSLNEALNLRRDQWDQHYGVIAKIDMVFNRLGDIWNTLMGKSIGGSSITMPDYGPVLGSISYYTGLILSKFDNFIVPDLQAIVGGGVAAAGAGGGEVLNFYGNITIQAASTSDLVQKLKSRRVVRGIG